MTKYLSAYRVARCNTGYHFLIAICITLHRIFQNNRDNGISSWGESLKKLSTKVGSRKTFQQVGNKSVNWQWTCGFRSTTRSTWSRCRTRRRCSRSRRTTSRWRARRPRTTTPSSWTRRGCWRPAAARPATCRPPAWCPTTPRPCTAPAPSPRPPRPPTAPRTPSDEPSRAPDADPCYFKSTAVSCEDTCIYLAVLWIDINLLALLRS